jgi:hypothetical protein
MNTDTAEVLATLDRIMPDAPPAISPQEQHRNALKDQLAAAQGQLEELASAVRLCDQDIQAPQAIAAEIAALEQKRADALAAGYLRRRAADVRKLDADIAALKASLEPARSKAEGAAAARRVLIAEQSSQQAIVDGMQRDLALSGALGPAAYGQAAESYRQDQRRLSVVRQQEIAQEHEQQKRQRAEEERQRRQRMGQCGPIGHEGDLPAWMDHIKA